ncbi:MAG TPA: hypothetical protein VHM24_14130, partial [Gemmatimonadaceae bacterium]|nr:hypothetical protein [Gemmatimonadaceae bacterium]
LGLVTTALVASTIAFRGERSGLIIGNTQQITSAPGLEIHPSISPDGRMIAYIAGTPGVRSRLFVRQLSGGRAIALTDSSANVRWPRWSPDGSEILYGADEQKWIIPALGGSPTPVPGLDSLQQCTWSNSGDRFACARRRDGALIIADRGGGNHRIVTAGAADGVVAPAWSTDDKLIAFTKGNGDFLGGLDIGNLAPSSIWVIRAEGGTAVKVTDDTHLNTAPVWTSDGALLFVSSLGGTRDIYLQRLSGKLAPRGEPTRLTTGLNPHTISLSRDGRRLAYSVFNTVANIWTAPTGGSAESNTAAAKPVTSGNQTIEQGFVSPDGRWLAYDSNLNGNQDIYKLDLAGAEPQQLTRNDYDDFFPFWSPDGKEITFHSLKNGNRDLYVMDANGTNVRPVLEAPGEQLAPEWRDPQTIVYVGQTDSVFEVRRTRGVWGKPKFLFKASGGNYSPDGAQLIRVVDGGVLCKDCPPGPYVSRSDGSNARPIPVPRIQEVFEKGGAVAWSRDSRHAYAHIREKDGSASIWQLPINDDDEKRVLHFSDPARQPYRTTFDVYGGNIYFTIGDRQSDVWVMDLKKR